MKTDSKKTMSLGYFNLARGLGMVLILLGHSMNLYLPPEEYRNPGLGTGTVIGGGIMAAFFMISGFGFYKRSPKKCFLIQKKLLLYPYIFVAGAVLLTKAGLAVLEKRSFWKHGGELVLTYLFGLNAEGGGKVFGIPIESVSIFWFVLALFGGWLLYNGIMQLHSHKIQICCIAGCVVLSYILTLISKVWPYCLPMALLAVGYLAAGEFVKKYNLLERKISPKWWILIGGSTVISGIFGDVNIVACQWRLGLVDVWGTFCAGFLILRLYALFMKKEKTGKIIGALEEIGFNSISVVCIHAYEKIIFPWYRVAGFFPAQPWIGVGLCFLGRCIVIYLIYKMFFYIKGKINRKKKQKIILT